LGFFYLAVSIGDFTSTLHDRKIQERLEYHCSRGSFLGILPIILHPALVTIFITVKDLLLVKHNIRIICSRHNSIDIVCRLHLLFHKEQQHRKSNKNSNLIWRPTGE
jgi:hypothetical protein